MPQFSLLRIFVATAGLAAGFAIWRLPKGNWTDVLIYAVGFYYAASFAQKAVAVDRYVVSHPTIPREERYGMRFTALGMLGVAVLLLGCWCLRYLAADELILKPPDRTFIEYVAHETLPNDLAVLTMLVAASFTLRSAANPKVTRWWKRAFGVAAVLGGALAALVYWDDRLLVTYLVYLAITGIIRAQPARLLPPERNVPDSVWANQFAIASLIGACVVATNVLLLWAIARYWNRPRVRWPLLGFLTLSVGAQGTFSVWLYGKGVWQLSPEMAESMHWPPWQSLSLVIALALVAASAVAWRVSSRFAENQLTYAAGRQFFHETWMGSLLLGLVLLAVLVIGQIKLIVATANLLRIGLNWDSIAYGLFFYPAQLIYWAAGIGAFAICWLKWRQQSDCQTTAIQLVEPAKFGVFMLAITCVLVLSAPIVAALAFSFWLVNPLGKF
jgi:hypothetical protein